GVVDNLGVTALAAAYQNLIDTAPPERKPYERGAVFIVIDARTQFDAELSSKSDIGTVGSLEAGTGLMASTLLNRVSSATLADLTESYRLYQAAKLLVRDAFGGASPGARLIEQWQSPDAEPSGGLQH